MRKNTGITLVALVITIIVLIILAGVTIHTLFNEDGIIQKAEQGKSNYADSTIEEATGVNRLSNTIIDNEKEEEEIPPVEEDTTPPVIHSVSWNKSTGTLSVQAEDEQSSVDEYLFYVDNSETPISQKESSIKIQIPSGTNGGNYQNPYIPKAFWHKEGTVEEGYVISDVPNVTVKVKDGQGNTSEQKLIGNEFVWVPVDGTKIKWERKAWKIGSSTQDISSKFTEAQNTAVQTSITTYGGFYIGRYEAGDGNAKAPRNGSTGASNPAVSKKGAYVYNYVKQSEAQQIASKMYTKATDGITSCLVSSYAWDTMLTWLETKGYSMTNSQSWGNYNNSTGLASTNSGQSNMNYTTGRSEYWKACNIYDLAGNVQELTTEKYSNSSFPVVYRGGSFSSNATSYPAAYRSSYVSTSYNINDLGFRCMIYK